MTYKDEGCFQPFTLMANYFMNDQSEVLNLSDYFLTFSPFMGIVIPLIRPWSRIKIQIVITLISAQKKWFIYVRCSPIFIRQINSP